MQLPGATLEWKNKEVECTLIYQGYQSMIYLDTPNTSHQSPCGIHWLGEFSKPMYPAINPGLQYFIIDLGLVCITQKEMGSLGLLSGCYPLVMLVMRTPRTEYDLPEPPEELPNSSK